MKKQDLDIFTNLNVLIADNLDNMRATLAAMLTKLGCARIYQAKDGIEAQRLLEKHDINLIISEWDLPKLTGLELLRTVRLREEHKTIPFVMVTAHIEQGEVLSAVKNGVSEYVVKPFNIKMLATRLTRAILNPIKSTATFLSQDTQSPKHVRETEKMSILVVDDMPDNIRLISEILRSKYKISAALNGKKALEICESDKPPALILLDVMMPEMDGFEVCQRLKSNPQTAHIAVIFVTALNKVNDMVKGLELGAIDYITKPIKPAVLEARVNTHSQLIHHNLELHNQVDSLLENAHLRNKFDRIIQHDLKKPLLDVMRFAENIKVDFHHKERVKVNGESILKTAEFLIDSIDNLLILLRLEDGNYQYTPERVNLSEQLTQVMDTLQHIRISKHLEIAVDIPDSIYIAGEAFLTKSIFSRLYLNALEAAARGTQIDIRVYQDNDQIITRISNYGEIPIQVQGGFFDKYTTFGKHNSSGLGAYAAKLMTEIQQGGIWFETSPESGTQLYFSLLKH